MSRPGAEGVAALLEAYALKAVDRRGWVRAGVARPESVAAHSWGVATLVLVLCHEDVVEGPSPNSIDVGRALAYAVVHDLPEAWVGDVTPHDGVSPEDKHRREQDAMDALGARIPRGAALRALWTAYEAQADPEARLVRQLDRLDMALQAVVYADAGAVGMAEFLRSADAAITDPALRAVFEALVARLGPAKAPSR